MECINYFFGTSGRLDIPRRVIKQSINMSIEHPQRMFMEKKGVVVPAHQAGSNSGHIMNYVFTPETMPASNALVAGQKYSMKLTPANLQGIINQLTLRIDVTENGTSSANFAPSPLFINKVAWRQPGAKGNEVLKTEYGDTLFVENCAWIEHDNQNLDGLNVSAAYSRGKIHKQSAAKSYRFRLVSNPWSINHSHMYDIKNDIYLDIDFAAGVTSAGSGVPTVTGCYLEVQASVPDGNQLSVMRNIEHKYQFLRYLDVIRDEKTSQTLTASTAYNFDLKAFADRDLAGLMFMVRADNYTNSSEGYLKCVNLDGGTVDIVNGASQSIYGNSQVAPALDVIRREVFARMFKNKKFSDNRHVYILPFSNDLVKAAHGIKDGSLRMEDNYKLVITPPAAGVAAVQTVNLNNPANDGGYYKLAHKGFTTNSLAYNATAASIKSALEALPSFLNHPGSPLTVTASGTAETDFTLTFASTVEPPNEPEDLVQLVSESLNDGTVADFGSTSVTTHGKLGFTTGSTYTITVYGYYFRNLVKKSGKLAVKDD